MGNLELLPVKKGFALLLLWKVRHRSKSSVQPGVKGGKRKQKKFLTQHINVAGNMKRSKAYERVFLISTTLLGRSRYANEIMQEHRRDKIMQF